MRKSEHWWKERLSRQTAAINRLDDIGPDATDDEIIAATAEYLITRGSSRLHLSILGMSADRPVSYDWRYKNSWGISTTDEARARAWIGECMRQGYGVFHSYKKHGSGGGMGSVAAIRQRRQRDFGPAEPKQDAQP